MVGFVVFPSRPESRMGGWGILTKEDRELARSRLIGNGSEQPELTLNKAAFAKIFTSWHWYGFVALYIVFDQAVVVFTGPFSLFLKAHKDTYSISQINNIPTTQAALAIISALIGGYWADSSGKMWLPAAVIMSVTYGIFAIRQSIITLTSTSLFGSLCLAIWEIPLALKMFSYIVAGMNGGLNPMLFGWASQVVYIS